MMSDQVVRPCGVGVTSPRHTIRGRSVTRNAATKTLSQAQLRAPGKSESGSIDECSRWSTGRLTENEWKALRLHHSFGFGVNTALNLLLALGL